MATHHLTCVELASVFGMKPHVCAKKKMGGKRSHSELHTYACDDTSSDREKMLLWKLYSVGKNNPTAPAPCRFTRQTFNKISGKFNGATHFTMCPNFK